MQKLAVQITQNRLFQPFVMGIILLASVLVGLETYPALHEQSASVFRLLDLVIQTIFTIEVVLRIVAYGKEPWKFFRSGWNVFDFLVTALFYLPFGGSFAAVLRLVRILRVFRLITALPRLQLLVGALIKSIPSIGYVAILLFVQFYIFAIIGNVEFGKTDPKHFGDLGSALVTLFEIVTLEGWVDIYQSQPNVVMATLFFISFIVLGTMIVLNLFIGVVLNGFEEVKQEMEDAEHKQTPSLQAELSLMSKELADLQFRLKRLAKTKKSR